MSLQNTHQRTAQLSHLEDGRRRCHKREGNHSGLWCSSMEGFEGLSIPPLNAPPMKRETPFKDPPVIVNEGAHVRRGSDDATEENAANNFAGTRFSVGWAATHHDDGWIKINFKSSRQLSFRPNGSPVDDPPPTQPSTEGIHPTKMRCGSHQPRWGLQDNKENMWKLQKQECNLFLQSVSCMA